MFVTSLAASYHWQIEAIDVQKTILKFREPGRQLYVVPPREAVGDDKYKVCKLKKAVYGFGDAAREGYMTVRSSLTSIGLKQSKIEPSMFYLTNKDGKLVGIMCVYVDDISLHGNRQFRAVIEILKEKLKVGKHQKLDFLFCGMKFNQKATNKTMSISLDPSKLNLMSSIAVKRSADRKIIDREETEARNLIGTLQWFASKCRPDLSYSLAQALSFETRDKNGAIFEMINKIISKFGKYRQNRLVFEPLKQPLEMEVFGDTSMDGDNQQRLFAILRQSGTEKKNVLSCRSRASERKTWSTLSGGARFLQ